MRSNKLTKALAAAGLGLMMIAGSANAAPTFYPPVTLFEDDNLDFFIDVNGNNNLDIGDRLVSILKFNTTAGAFGGGPSTNNPQLTGISDITVTSKVANATPGLFDFGFGPTVGFRGNVDLNGGLAGAGTGIMVALWLDPTNDLTVFPPSANCTSLATCLAAAQGPTLWAESGFTGDVNELWNAIGATDTPALLAGIAASTKVGAINFWMNVITNNTGQVVLPQLCFAGPFGCPGGGDNSVDVIGSGDLLGGQGLPAGIIADNGFARSDTDFQLATIPEPGTIALLGVALLGFGASIRRRASSSGG